MSIYPGQIDTWRTVQNLPGLTYNPDDTKTLFADDITAINEAIYQTQLTLGINPQGSDADVTARLTNVEQTAGSAQSEASNAWQVAFEAIYPIGITIMSTTVDLVNAGMAVGTWTQIAEGDFFNDRHVYVWERVA